MDLSQRTGDFIKLGQLLGALGNDAFQDVQHMISEEEWTKWKEAIDKAEILNPWFTKDNIHLSLRGISHMLNESKVVDWLSNYHQNLKDISQKKVGVIMAGNIPLVGFHDFFCVLLTGHHLLAKLSSNDQVLFPVMKEQLILWNEDWDKVITFVEERLQGHEAVIATGSNNTSRYFEYYFREVPKIIRKNRSGVAILNGDETLDELKDLGKDIFQFFGLGCRNISKIYLPEGYELQKIYEAIFDYGEVINHNKYCNNYDYHRAVYLLNQTSFLDNNFLLLIEQQSDFASPLGVLYYAYYQDKKVLLQTLQDREDEVQCIVSKDHIPFGKSQFPEIWDYADGVDTMKFLTSL